jgi:hypothetical protein
VVALDRRAGIVEGHWTPLAARQAAFLVAHVTPQEAERVLAELGNMRPSKSSLDRLPKRLSEHWEAEREGFEASLRERLEVPEEAVTMAASLDGVLVPMKDGGRGAKREQARAEGKETRGPAGYQEVGCATLSFYNAAGERLHTVRLARMPEAKKRTLKTTLAAEVERALAERPLLTVVKVADGAKDNWTFLDALVPQGEAVVDFFHAAGHLQDALDAAYGEHTPSAQAQGHEYRLLLRDDVAGVAKVIRALVYLKDKHPRRSAHRPGARVFPSPPSPDGLRGAAGAAPADRIGGDRGGLQDAREPAPEALRDALVSCRWPGDPDAAGPGAERALRAGLGDAIGHLQERGRRARERHAVPAATGRLSDQFQTYTLPKEPHPTPRAPYPADLAPSRVCSLHPSDSPHHNPTRSPKPLPPIA